MYFPLLHSDGHFIYATLFHYVMYSDVVDVFELSCSTYRHVADLKINASDLHQKAGCYTRSRDSHIQSIPIFDIHGAWKL